MTPPGGAEAAQAPSPLPTFGPAGAAVRRERDLARGSQLFLFWGGPVAWLFGGSFLGSWEGWTSQELGVVFVVGTAWLGASCLVNALRCGRTHCWIDGVCLPLLAAAGALNAVGLVSLSWDTFNGLLVLIVAGSFVIECVTGPYLARPVR